MSISSLRKIAQAEQVAAVCYRIRSEIEFLLVRTRGGDRWTFPKGSAEPGLTPAQAAALEAFEEAGVHGRIEETSFARYASRKSGKSRRSSFPINLVVNAHLCQVLRLARPKEPDRERTWFSAEEARLRLRKGRDDSNAAEFARVIEKAVSRIERSQKEHGLRSNRGHKNEVLQSFERRPFELQGFEKDALQKVQFEARPQPLGWGTQVPLLPNGVHKLDALQGYSSLLDNQPRKLLQGDVLPFNVPSSAGSHANRNRARKAITPGGSPKG